MQARPETRRALAGRPMSQTLGSEPPVAPAHALRHLALPAKLVERRVDVRRPQRPRVALLTRQRPRCQPTASV